MVLFPYELRKLIDRKLILILMFVFVLNFFLFYNHISPSIPKWSQNEEWKAMIKEEMGKQPEHILQEWNQLYEELEVIQQWNYDLLETPSKKQQQIIEKYQGTEWMTNPEKLANRKKALEQRIFEYNTIVVEYPQFLKNMEENDKKMAQVSVFADKDSYSYRNIKKTMNDFKKLGNQNLQPMDETGFSLMIRYYITDMLVMILIGLGCVQILDKNRKNILSSLLFSTKRGGRRLLLAQMEAIVVWIVLVVVIFYGSNSILMTKLFQINQWDAALQSMNLFRTAVIPWTVGTYLLGYLIWKVVAGIVTAGFMILFCVVFGGGNFVWICYGVLVGGGFLLWRYIPVHPVLSIIQFLNPFGLFDCYQILGNYQNLNFFSYPISLLKAAVIFSFISIIICNIISFSVVGKIQWERKKRSEEKERKRTYTTKLLIYEWEKVFWGQRVWVALIIAIILMLVQLQGQEKQYQFDEYIYNNYIKEYEGELTLEKERQIEEEKERLESAPEQFSKLEEEVKNGVISEEEYKETSIELEKLYIKQVGFKKFYNQYQYLRTLRDSNIQGSFLNEFRTNELFFNNNKNYLYGIEYIILMIFTLSGIFDKEAKYGMMKLIYTTPNGEQRFFSYKMGIATLIGLVGAGIIMLPQYYFMLIGMNKEGWSASIQSMEQMKTVLIPLTIKQYTVCYFILQLLSGALMGLFIALLARILKKQFTTIVVTNVLLLFPITILWMMEITKEDAVFEKFIGAHLSIIFSPMQSLFALSTALGNGFAITWLILPIAVIILGMVVHRNVKLGKL